MSKIEITSKNQSGGITAQNVSFGNNINLSNQPPSDEDKKKQPKWKKIILIITGTVAFLASVVKLLEYFSIFPFNKIQ